VARRSRNVLGIIRNAGIEPTIIEYLAITSNHSYSDPTAAAPLR
jgi:hypothetical protein